MKKYGQEKKSNFGKFMLLWAGELISAIGGGLTSFGLGVYVFNETGSAAGMALVTLLGFLPVLLLSVPAGVLADRYDRRLLMIIGDLFSGLGLAYVLWNIQAGSDSMLLICIGVTFNAVFVALLEPSFRATITELLTEEEYARASGMVQIAGNAKFLISPALAGILLAVADIRLILLIDIGTFLITVTTVAIVRKSVGKAVKTERQSIGREMRLGFAEINKSKGIRILIILMSFVCFFVGILQTLTSPMVLAVSNAETVGIMESLCAVGMLLGSVFIGILGIKKNFSTVLCVAGILSGIFIALTGVNKSIFVTGAGIFLFFLALPFMNTSADVLIRKNIPNELQGRVWGIISLLSQTGTVLAYALSGVLADFVFEPLLSDNGVLSDSIGALIGTGTGRGIGFMLILSGICIIPAAFAIGRSRSIRSLQ